MHPPSIEEALQGSSILHDKSFVGGEWVGSNSTFPVCDPATDKVIANVANLTIKDFTTAIEHAHTAFKAFKTTQETARAKMLHAWAALIRQHAKDLGVILTMENGKTLAEAEAEVEYGASFITCTNIVIRQPIGVCGIITPWNFPIAMITRKLAPAIAAGCTVAVKPPSETPLCTLALTALAVQAGIPPNVIQVVTTKDRNAATELYTHPPIKKISFTGSTGVRKMITEKAAKTMKKVSMELGGNAPYIVFNDADVDIAVAGVLACKFRCSGQTCVCANRLYIQSGIHDEFVEKLKERMAGFKIGSGLDPSVTHGPLINEAAVRKTKEHNDDAVSKGAMLVVGGKRPDAVGYLIQPALLTGITSKMLVAREETFGPLAPLLKFEMEDNVVAQANDKEFGLAGFLFSNDLRKIWRVANALEVGMVGANTGVISACEAPFGGIKESGMGKEGIKYGLAEFQVVKNITLGNLHLG
ncbi:succinate-semialdehyde dehydrogenase [Hyaloscypha finlandica]|nr:succinate-semialdehyde dehydrogenase [Hyaloscypha finlandica]